MPELIHIHEDNWEMRRLYPLAARAEAEADMRAAIAAAERNRLPSGGYSDMHIIGAPDHTYVDAGLRLADAAAALEAVMPRVRRFHSTAMAGFDPACRDAMGSYNEDAWCFGLGTHCYVKIEPRGDLVERIWFDIESGDQDVLITLRKAFRAIDALSPSIITDYFLEMMGAVTDHGFMADYLTTCRALYSA
ncbi:hypothetical protein P1X14_07130 [Sphingomonas sp. AOB5]|uniref:hypothetical protein n=1 Tax=Sphingomonas sp. AOB5 TaxID=3034017 RepID=UPI0023F92537|nr:hypothetical protein [Sphingomonas sp. AOB5]MDF7775012.1 hypothetical protein [Sphingomonas sp. AOB5]